MADLFDTLINPITVSAFYVREVTGSDPIKIVLSDWALPERGLRLKGSQKVSINFAGSPVGASQVLGARENDTQVKGEWLQRYIGDGRMATINDEPVTEIKVLTETFDRMRKRGQIVEIQWEHIVRQGHLADFEQNWIDRYTVEWMATFEWLSQGELVTPGRFTLDFDVTNISYSWRDAMKNLLAAIQAPFAVLTDFADTVNSLVNDVQQAVNAITDTVAAIGAAILAPFEAVRRVVGLLENIKTAVAQIISTVLTLPSQILAQTILIARDLQSLVTTFPNISVDDSSNTLVNAPTVSDLFTGQGARTESSIGVLIEPSASDLAQAEAYGRGIVAQARQMRAQALVQQEQFLRQLEPELEATFVAREGTDLRRVSEQFYGSTDGWQRLRAFNGLASSEVPAGTVVLVPRVDSALASSCCGAC